MENSSYTVNEHKQNLIHLLIRFCLILLLLLTFPRKAAAHSELVDSDPADGIVLEESPTQITAWFSEELESNSSSLEVFDSQNQQVDNGDGGVDLNDLDHLTMVVSLPPLPAGEYTVRWTSVSVEDGDAEEGEFSFNVSTGSVAPDNSPTLFSSNPLVWITGGAVVVVVAGLAILNSSRRKSRS